jgi:hypothetical protein
LEEAVMGTRKASVSEANTVHHLPFIEPGTQARNRYPKRDKGLDAKKNVPPLVSLINMKCHLTLQIREMTNDGTNDVMLAKSMPFWRFR